MSAVQESKGIVLSPLLTSWTGARTGNLCIIGGQVRCDGRLSPCRNCERLGFKCSFTRRNEPSAEAGATADVSSEEEKPRRLRGRNACSQCRMQKLRCSNTGPKCANCMRRGTFCSYSPSKRSRRRSEEKDLSSTPSADTVEGACNTFATQEPPVDTGELPHEPHGRRDRDHGDPSHDEATELVSKFFEHLYPVPSYAFLHPSTTVARCKQGILERSLLLAICALTSLRLNLANVDRETGASWAAHVEEIIWQNLEHPSMPSLQALLLTISYRMETGSFERAFMLTGITARAASAMGLNHEHADLDRVSEEGRRRTLWCFKLLESYFSIGLPEFELCPFECIYLQPPSCEDEFGFARSLADQNELGALNVCVRLLSIRRDIMKLTRELAVCDEPFLQLTQVTRSLERDLLQLRTEMPNNGNVSPADLNNLIDSAWLPRHLMMITLWHGCFCDLYRIFLPGYPEAPPRTVLGAIDESDIQRAKSICMEHALAAINLLCDLNQACTTPRLLEFANGVCAYHCTRLMLFIARTSSEPYLPSLGFAVSRAELCLAAIKRFFRPSALAQPVLNDMAQLIKAVSSHSSATESIGVFHQAHRGRNFALQIPYVAQPRQRLAVHSLLRQADFSGDEDAVLPARA